MDLRRDIEQYDASITNMRKNFNQVVAQNEQRRRIMEQDFKEIQSRLDHNKQTMENIKMQIEKVTGVLTRLKDFTMNKENIGIGDCDFNKEEKTKLKNDEFLRRNRQEMEAIEKAISGAIQKSKE